MKKLITRIQVKGPFTLPDTVKDNYVQNLVIKGRLQKEDPQLPIWGIGNIFLRNSHIKFKMPKVSCVFIHSGTTIIKKVEATVCMLSMRDTNVYGGVDCEYFIPVFENYMLAKKDLEGLLETGKINAKYIVLRKFYSLYTEIPSISNSEFDSLYPGVLGLWGSIDYV